MQVEALSKPPRFEIVHLARRFFQVAFARPLTPAEQAAVAALLKPAEASLFWAQAPADQRHGYETMRRAGHQTRDPAVLRAAVLHDVGKAAATVGPLARSAATVLDVARVELRGRFAAYRNHGALGAASLAAVGAEPLAVDFAARHPDPDPMGNDPDAWRILLEADDV